MKRLERYDQGFRDLLHALFGLVKAQLKRHGYCDEMVRLESSIFISAPWATTPFHFDPEVNFFTQIEGEKIYRLYEPSALGEDEVEPIYLRAVVDIGQVDLNRRDPAGEHVFRLLPGTGLHQPQDSPHWVETTGSRSGRFPIRSSMRRGRHAVGRACALSTTICGACGYERSLPGGKLPIRDRKLRQDCIAPQISPISSASRPIDQPSHIA